MPGYKHQPTHDHRKVILQEVGPRDGLQNERRVLSVHRRIELIQRLGAAGIPRIQVGSFVNPRKVPQMADTDMVWQGLSPKKGVRYTALVLNERGLRSAMACGIPHVEIYVSASETHSLKNSGVPGDVALSTARSLIRLALAEGLGVTAGVMCAFGCFYEGAVPADQVLRIVQTFWESGAKEIALADTAGLGQPDQVGELIKTVSAAVAPIPISLHLHDTHGLAMENLRIALGLGIRHFDTAVSGLGGCPFIPGAAGNISTETTVALLSSFGFYTDIDATSVRETANWLRRILNE